MNRTQALNLIGSLVDAFPTCDIQPRHVEAYVREMLDLDERYAADGCAKLIRSSRFFPSIADIRESSRRPRSAAEVLKEWK